MTAMGSKTFFIGKIALCEVDKALWLKHPPDFSKMRRYIHFVSYLKSRKKRISLLLPWCVRR